MVADIFLRRTRNCYKFRKDHFFFILQKNERKKIKRCVRTTSFEKIKFNANVLFDSGNELLFGKIMFSYRESHNDSSPDIHVSRRTDGKINSMTVWPIFRAQFQAKRKRIKFFDLKRGKFGIDFPIRYFS